MNLKDLIRNSVLRRKRKKESQVVRVLHFRHKEVQVASNQIQRRKKPLLLEEIQTNQNQEEITGREEIPMRQRSRYSRKAAAHCQKEKTNRMPIKSNQKIRIEAEEKEIHLPEKMVAKTKGTKMKAYSCFIVLIMALITFTGCDSDRVYEEYQGMDKLTWSLQDTITFKMENPIPKGPSIIAIRYNDDFPYRNLYLRYTILDSLGQNIESQLINIPLFESTSGKPLGRGFGNTFTKYDTLPFTKDDAYHEIQFLQYMRLEDLKGVEAVGLKRIKP